MRSGALGLLTAPQLGSVIAMSPSVPHIQPSNSWPNSFCRYLVSLIAEADGVHTDLNEFGLEAMNIALNAGGTGDNRGALCHLQS